MHSFKSLAQKARKNPDRHYINEDRRILEAALLEIAHALSRGRKPTSCSVLSERNIQEWLWKVFHDCSDKYLVDGFGDPCSLVDDLGETLNWAGHGPHVEQSTLKLRSAIRLCRDFVKPKQLPSFVKGDHDYQARNKHTNLKRKREFIARRNGSWFDYSDAGFSDPHDRHEFYGEEDSLHADSCDVDRFRYDDPDMTEEREVTPEEILIGTTKSAVR